MRLWVAAVALLAVPTAALACSCLATDDPKQLARFAADAAKGAIALVEIETLVTYQDSNGAGERMRVVRALAGAAPTEFRVERRGIPFDASCDLTFNRGQVAVLILYPAGNPSGSEPLFRISGLCTDVLLAKPAFRQAVARSIGGPGERG